LDEVRQHDSQVGFIGWHPRYVKGVIEKIAYYIEGQVGDRPDLEPVSLWGNVARGIYEAAIIYAGLQHAGVESSFHLFRVSPFAFSDKAAVLIGEPDKMPGWVIGADNFSGGGRSVTEAIRLFSEFDCEAVSTYLTHGGFLWRRDRGFNLEFSDEEVLDNRLMFRIDLDEAI